MPVLLQAFVSSDERDNRLNVLRGKNIYTSLCDFFLGETWRQRPREVSYSRSRIVAERSKSFDIACRQLVPAFRQMRFNYSRSAILRKVSAQHLVGFQKRYRSTSHEVRRRFFLFPGKVNRFEIVFGNFFIKESAHLNSVREEKSLSIIPNEQRRGARFTAQVDSV